MVERIPQHRHCQNCDKAIPYDKKYCDDKCEQEYVTVRKAKKKQLMTFYIIMVIIFISAVILSFMG